ncbi:hypothetical protein EUX98_g4999 [Antrodiella citrinella]|uniref:AB hydrolase-1 domain-containing protein n=1 Tax=Antrodiella citrinella TaxID=2447956 RepID=A0A4S4MUG0_9APHY|nr:hypothetical protein EUX98_g4999 [Antrodiella citrinella]
MSEYNLPHGDVDFHVSSAGKRCKTHYWISGELKSGNTPLVVAHGGPGSTHLYVATHIELTKTHGIPVILYDQIGNGLSTHLPEKRGDADFWTVQLFIDELDNLVEKLGISDSYDLLGHSWGGMMGSSFAVRQPKGLRRLVLASSVARMQDWMDAGQKLQKGLPQDVQATISKHEAAGTTDSQDYEQVMEVFYSRHICRVQPLPSGFILDNEWMAQDNTVYHTMNGPSEFHIQGSLKTFDVVSELHKINVVTLVTNGRYDGAQDSVVKKFLNIPKVKWVHFAESSHTPHYEEPERYFKIVGDFLTDDSF